MPDARCSKAGLLLCVSAVDDAFRQISGALSLDDEVQHVLDVRASVLSDPDHVTKVQSPVLA
eukprot:scaffold1170_cov256-Pinguiococcus_pyrenoidosus.AAC.5